MNILICPDAYRKKGDKRGKVMCKVSGSICAHQYFCEVVCKFRQLDSAKNCPGRSDNGTG